MRAVVQRVSSASVTVVGETVGAIDLGLLVYLGVASDDDDQDADYVAKKIVGLRVFSDDDGKMNHAVGDVEGSVLLVSQFTLYGDVRRGRRPSFEAAAAPERAQLLYEKCGDAIRRQSVHVETGTFRATMNVEATVAGPVTILLDSKKAF